MCTLSALQRKVVTSARELAWLSDNYRRQTSRRSMQLPCRAGQRPTGLNWKTILVVILTLSLLLNLTLLSDPGRLALRSGAPPQAPIPNSYRLVSHPSPAGRHVERPALSGHALKLPPRSSHAAAVALPSPTKRPHAFASVSPAPGAASSGTQSEVPPSEVVEHASAAQTRLDAPTAALEHAGPAKPPPHQPPPSPAHHAGNMTLLQALDTLPPGKTWAQVKPLAPAYVDRVLAAAEASLPESPGDDAITRALAGVVAGLSTRLLPLYQDAQPVPPALHAIPAHLLTPVSPPPRQQPCTRVVVGLTTLPSRAGHLVHVVQALVSQSRLPDAIYIAVPPFALRTGQPYALPAWLLRHPLLHIVPLPADFGPASKLFGALFQEEDPHTCIVTVDDDAVPDRHLVLKLVDGAAALPGGAAVGFSGWNITCAAGLDCWQHGGWNYDFVRNGMDDVCTDRWQAEFGEWHCGAAVLCAPEPADVLMGVSGVLFRRWAWNASAMDILPEWYASLLPEGARLPPLPGLTPATRRLVYLADDVWFGTWLSRVGVPRYVIPDVLQASTGRCPTVGEAFLRQQTTRQRRNWRPRRMTRAGARGDVDDTPLEEVQGQCHGACLTASYVEPGTALMVSVRDDGGRVKRGPGWVALGVDPPPAPASALDLPALPREANPSHLLEDMWSAMQEAPPGALASSANVHVTPERLTSFPVDVLDALHSHASFDMYNKLIVHWALAHGRWQGRWVPERYFREDIWEEGLVNQHGPALGRWEQDRAAAGAPARAVNGSAFAYFAAFHPTLTQDTEGRSWFWLEPREGVPTYIIKHGSANSAIRFDMENRVDLEPPSWWPPPAWNEPMRVPVAT